MAALHQGQNNFWNHPATIHTRHFKTFVLYIMKEHSRDVYGLWVCVRPPCVVRMCGTTMGLWGCVWLWIVCEDCGACEDNHSLPTNAFAMVSTQRANTVATNNNDNSHNAKYRCNKILNQTDFLKQIMLYQVRHEWWWSVNESIRTAAPCIILCPPWCLWPSQIAPSSPAARRRC